jgi:hypothetical protein
VAFAAENAAVWVETDLDPTTCDAQQLQKTSHAFWCASISRRRFNEYLTTRVGEFLQVDQRRTVGAKRATKNGAEREGITMFAKNDMSKVGAIMIITGVALGWSTGAEAEANERATSQARAAEAQQQADAARQRATELARAGGWAYKTGLVERAQRDVARYQAEANQALAEAQPCPPPATPSPVQAAALARLEELRQAGGWAYKTGAVARAESDLQSKAAGDEAEPVVPSPAQAAALGRLEELRQAGGWAYKTGAVARAERDVQSQTAPQPTPICGGREDQPRVLMTSR